MIDEAEAARRGHVEPADVSARFLVLFYEWTSYWPEGDGFMRELIGDHMKQFPNHVSSRRMCRVLLKHKRASRVWLAPSVFRLNKD